MTPCITCLAAIGLSIATASAVAAHDRLPVSGFDVTAGDTGQLAIELKNFPLHADDARQLVGVHTAGPEAGESIGSLFDEANEFTLPVFAFPKNCFPQDHLWEFARTKESLMLQLGMFDVKTRHSSEVPKPSGANISGLTLQDHKHGIDKIVIAGRSPSFCLEGQMRERLKQDLEVMTSHLVAHTETVTPAMRDAS